MKIIAVTSGKGGTGKSCVAAYTGAALAESGKKVLLLELGSTVRSLDLIVGVHDEALFDLDDLLSGRCDEEKAIIPAKYCENLYLLPACSLPTRTVVDGQHFNYLAGRLRKWEFDYVILDGVDFEWFPPAIPLCILAVCTPDSLCIRATSLHVARLYDNGAREVRLVLNNVPAQVLPMYGAEDFDDVIDLIGAQLIAVIPASPKMQYSSNNAEHLDTESLVPKIFDNLAARLCGKQRPLLIR